MDRTLEEGQGTRDGRRPLTGTASTPIHRARMVAVAVVKVGESHRSIETVTG